MFRPHYRRTNSKSLSHNHRNRKHLDRKREIRSVGKSRSPHNRNRRPETGTAVEDAGEAAVVEAGAVVELKQVGLPDTLKPILLQSKISPEQLLHQQRE